MATKHSAVVRNMVLSALVLAVFSIIGTGLVAWTYQKTASRIARNEREALLQKLNILVPAKRYDNNPLKDSIEVTDPALLGTDKPVPVYRARMDGKPVAAIFTPIAPWGYGGNIKLLVAINYDGTLAGVRVLEEHETPGLGDRIERNKSDWILGFDHRSLDNPTPDKWKVKKDGGVFDQFTGATITPRAVVKGIYHALLYYKAHRDALFAPAPKHGSGKGGKHG